MKATLNQYADCRYQYISHFATQLSIVGNLRDVKKMVKLCHKTANLKAILTPASLPITRSHELGCNATHYAHTINGTFVAVQQSITFHPVPLNIYLKSIKATNFYLLKLTCTSLAQRNPLQLPGWNSNLRVREWLLVKYRCCVRHACVFFWGGMWKMNMAGTPHNTRK